MIDASAIRDILEMYSKHGWVLRRVLLSKDLKERIGAEIIRLLAGIQVDESDIDAAWFSRPPKNSSVAWEIRHLSEMPYALLQNADENLDGFEDSLHAVEERLRETVLTAKSA